MFSLYATWNGQGTGGSGYSQDSNRFWCYVQSSDTGNNWTVAQYWQVAVGRYGTYNNSPAELMNPGDWNTMLENGGWIFVAGRFRYSNTSSYN